MSSVNCPAMESNIVMSPIQWSKLKDINHADPIGSGDLQCLLEVREVLRTHGKIDRLGIALLHSHFELKSNEVMLESADVDGRRLILEPVSVSDTGANDVGTIFKLEDCDFSVTSWCRSYCKRDFFGHWDMHNSQ